MCFSQARASWPDPPATLRAYSFAIDHEQKQIWLRAHFAEEPSEDDLDAISIIETEVDADFLDHFEGDTDTEIAAPGTNLAFLADAWRICVPESPATFATTNSAPRL